MDKLVPYKWVLGHQTQDLGTDETKEFIRARLDEECRQFGVSQAYCTTILMLPSKEVDGSS